MLLINLSMGLLGLVSFSTASPLTPPRELGLAWRPRARAIVESQAETTEIQIDDNGNTQVTDTTITTLTEGQVQSESELIALLQQELDSSSGTRDIKNIIRRNHFGSRNNNNNVNTIVVVVTQVVDIRDSNNIVERLMTHEVAISQNGATAQEVIQVTEATIISLGGSNNNRNGNNNNNNGASATGAVATGTGTAQAAIVTVDPSAPFQQSNQTVLLPSGAAAPAVGNVTFDPAGIIDAGSGLFVQQI